MKDTRQMTTIKLADRKDLIITGKIVDSKGQDRDIRITKFDNQNNVMGFIIDLEFGATKYIGAGAENPKLSDVKELTISFPTPE